MTFFFFEEKNGLLFASFSTAVKYDTFRGSFCYKKHIGLSNGALFAICYFRIYQQKLSG